MAVLGFRVDHADADAAAAQQWAEHPPGGDRPVLVLRAPGVDRVLT
jgi:hypothetical protein